MKSKNKIGQKIKYHEPPMKFDIALRKYIPDIVKLEELKKKLKKKNKF